ncbi:MAG: tetratricopeptide repeat protein [Magnetococcales bacterium]|nr:tetratricopeptide repeat protein [Magnetococcales bacterium]
MLWYKKALEINPNNNAALINSSLVLQAQGRTEEAIVGYQKAIRTQVNPTAHFNLGLALKELNRFDEAIEQYKKTLSIDPNYAGVHRNLGNVFIGQYKLDEAVACYKQALSINPNQPEIYGAIANAFSELGRLDEAVEYYQKALSLKPDDAEVYSNFGLTLESLCYDVLCGQRNITVDQITEKLPAVSDPNNQENSSISCRLAEQAIARLKVKQITGEDFLEDQKRIINSLPNVLQETAFNSQAETAPAVIGAAKRNSKKMVALVSLGRAGTGYLHSLLDGHPEISATPGVYLSGYFGRGVWQSIVDNGFENIASRFAQLHQVLFDSRSMQKTPSPFIGDIYGTNVGLGVAEGFDRMGEGRDQPLQLDQALFVRNLSESLRNQDSVNHGELFEYVHDAYEKSLGNAPENKKVILNHIHQIEYFSLSNLLKFRPDTALLSIIRNPVQSCESWAFKSNSDRNLSNGYRKYARIVSKLNRTLMDVNNVNFSTQDSVAIRLEDIKKDPKEAMRRLCLWLGISDSPTLYQSTMQGLEWWGDPSSVLYGKRQTEDHGPVEPIRDSPGFLFSERDRYILETLFYPVRARFGYTEENPAQFKKDLNDIRLLLDAPFDFERMLAGSFPSTYPTLEMTAAYKSFHAMLSGRWRLLHEKGTYPNMYRPLPV